MDSKEIKDINFLVTNINSILSYYADQDEELLPIVITKFWENINYTSFIDVKDVILQYKNKINILLNKTQDFSQYEHNYMPIGLKMSLVNIKNQIIRLKMTDYIDISNIQLFHKHCDEQPEIENI